MGGGIFKDFYGFLSIFFLKDFYGMFQEFFKSNLPLGLMGTRDRMSSRLFLFSRLNERRSKRDFRYFIDM